MSETNDVFVSFSGDFTKLTESVGRYGCAHNRGECPESAHA